MILRICTARFGYRGPDRLDITRKSGGPEGEPFAPSWAILGPALEARERAAGLLEAAAEIDRRELGARRQPLLFPEPMNEASLCFATELTIQAEDIESAAWAAYVPAYLAEMRESYRRNRAAWNALLARERVVLCCYCADRARCHRGLLAGILVRLGAVDEGEVAVAA